MRRFSWITTIVAALGMLASSASFAQNQANQDQTQGRDRAANQNQDRDADQSGQLPQALQKLDLTSEQKQKIRQTNQEISKKIQEAWREFHQAHMQAVSLEATWHAAVRDTLSEEDQKKFDEQRKQEQVRESRESRAQAGQRESNRAENRRNRRNREAQDSAQPGQDRRTADRDAEESRRRSGFRPGDQSEDQEGLIVIMLTSPIAYTSGTQQTPEQKQKCSEACQEYAKELTTAWKKVHESHHELVKLEAQRLSEIESHLNEDQLQELKKSRESGSQQSPSSSSEEQR